MTGSIPSEVGNAPRLETLRLENNFFEGTLVTEIGMVTTLTDLNVGFNDFNQKIPSEVGNLKKLRFFVLSGNAFSGRVPRYVQKVTSKASRQILGLVSYHPCFTTRFWLTIPKFSCHFCNHSEVGRMDALEYLRFNENLLFGKIPSEYGLLWNLKEINVATSGMGSFLPSELSLLTGLERLELGYNKFRGTLATELGLLTNLCKYNLSCYPSTSMGLSCDDGGVAM